MVFTKKEEMRLAVISKLSILLCVLMSLANVS